MVLNILTQYPPVLVPGHAPNEMSDNIVVFASPTKGTYHDCSGWNARNNSLWGCVHGLSADVTVRANL